MTVKLKLTPTAISKLEPQKNTYIAWDTDMSGFGVRVTPTGKRGYVYQQKVRGKSRRKLIGDFKSLALGRAKAISKDLQEDWTREANQLPINPNSLANKVTFEAALKRYKKHGQIQNVRTYEERDRELKRGFSCFEKRPISEITKTDISKALDKIEEQSGTGRANRMHSHLKSFFKWAVYEDLVGNNPAATIRPRQGYKPKERFLTLTEIGLVWAASCRMPDAPRSLIQLLILTGQRRGEVANAHVHEFNLRENFWTIPAERTKNKRSHIVPLGPMATEIISSLLEGSTSQYALTTNGTSPYQGFSKTLKILQFHVDQIRTWYNAETNEPPLAPLPYFTYHDFRRTLGTQWAEELEASPDIIMRHHNHTPQGIAGVYQRQQYLKQRMDLACQWEEIIIKNAMQFDKFI